MPEDDEFFTRRYPVWVNISCEGPLEVSPLSLRPQAVRKAPSEPRQISCVRKDRQLGDSKLLETVGYRIVEY
jgi:hypothetical protein